MSGRYGEEAGRSSSPARGDHPAPPRASQPRRSTMPDAKGRREGQPVRARSRTKSDTPSPELDDVYHEEGHAPSSAGYHPETEAEAPAHDAYRYGEKADEGA